MKNIRRGLGKGLGTGYKNLAPMDSHIHSLSAKGVKTISLKRAVYGKPKVPLSDREYSTMNTSMPVGTIKEWKTFLKDSGVKKVKLIDPIEGDSEVELKASHKQIWKVSEPNGDWDSEFYYDREQLVNYANELNNEQEKPKKEIKTVEEAIDFLSFDFQLDVVSLNAKKEKQVKIKLPKNIKFTETEELFVYPYKTKVDVPVSMTYDYAKIHFPEELESGQLIQFTARINFQKGMYESEENPNEHKGIFVGELNNGRESPNYKYV